jgi:threonine dehydrogenase-like Zn-dependent dehydrogenase
MMLTSSERSPSNSSLPTTAVSRVAVSAGIGRPAKAAARIYFPELLPDLLDGRIDPGRLLAHETDLDRIADAYAAMDERRAIKSVVRIGSP